jgi:hypothetical protein
MVRVSGYQEVAKSNGESFIALELTGGLEMVQSSSTGKFYATVRKVRVPSTFDENIAKMMIGEQLDGSIERVTVEPYRYVNKTTGEVMTLQHSYTYRPKGAIETIGQTQVMEMA